jgi:hypothetical protein
MAILKDEEEQKGTGLSGALGQPTSDQQDQAVQQLAPTAAPAGGAMIGSASPTPQVTAIPKQQKAGTGTFANLKSYLQAAQGGGKVAQAATQRVQNVATGAQKGMQQAGQAFGQRMEAGSLANLGTAGQEAQDIIGAARQTTYQAPPVQQVQPDSTISEPTQAPAQPQPQQYSTPEQQQRFADIINAQYQGPTSLQQAGLYESAAQKARVAQEAATKAQTAGGREALLRDIFSRGRDYSRGASKLDALLLNTSQQGVEQLQQQAQEAGKSQERLQALQNLTSAQAQGRAAEIQQVREGVRGEFTKARGEEEAAVETRIDSLIKTPAVDESGNPIPKLDASGKPVVDAGGNPVYLTEWERLPEYFRQSLANKAESTKKVQQEQIAKLNEQYPQIQQVRENEKRIDDLKSKLRMARFKLNSKRSRRENSAQIEKALARVTSLQNQIKPFIEKDKEFKSSPEYQDYKKQFDAANKMNLNQWTLSPEEAAVLGVASGEGLYNIRPDDIRTAEAERGRLISKDELSRQLALQQLAGLDTSSQLQKDLLYSDLSQAGTQDLASSLDVDAFRRLLDESQAGFKTAAEGANITGIGSKKVSRGNWAGTKTETYDASVKGNVADMLRQAGYNVGADTPEGVRSLLTDRDLLNRYLGATSTSRGTEANVGGSALEGMAAGAGTGASIGAMTGTGPTGAGIGATIGAGIGGLVGANTIDPVQATSDLYKELEAKLGIKGLGAIGQGIQDVRGFAATPLAGLGNIAGSNVFGDAFRGISGAIGGIDTGAMRAYGSAMAKDFAIQDLQRKYADFLKGQGFENRANIVDTEATRARAAALQDLLRRQG